MKWLFGLSVACWLAVFLLFAGTLCHTEPSFRAPQFFVEYDLSIPYTSQIQPDELSYHMKVWYDYTNARMKVETDDQARTLLIVDNTQYNIEIQGSEKKCKSQALDPAAAKGQIAWSIFLPYVYNKWTFVSSELIQDPTTGSRIREYQYYKKWHDYVFNYTIYTSEDGLEPIRTDLLGQSWVEQQGHIENYTQVYKTYKTGPQPDDAFEVPSVCSNPTTSTIQDDNSAFATRMKTRMTTPQLQVQNIITNKKFIDEYNQNNDGSHILNMNRFSLWSYEDFQSIMLPQEQYFDDVPLQHDFMDYLKEKGVYINESEIPDSLDWRDKGPVGPVLDQADCGGCWAFATAQSISAQYWMKTKNYVDFSVQQLLDCAWKEGLNGCNGGLAFKAMLYVKDAGGIASSSDYQYKGLNYWCQDKNVQFAAHLYDHPYGMAHQGDITGLKSIIQTFGPVAASFQVTEPFAYYYKGVFTNPECGAVQSSNHAVLVVGWGSENGMDYWIIKNSWGPYWGEKGYAKINMKYDCGITRLATFAFIDTSKVHPMNTFSNAHEDRDVVEM